MRFRWLIILLLFSETLALTAGCNGSCCPWIWPCSRWWRSGGCIGPCYPEYGNRYQCNRFWLPGWWGSADYLLIWRKKRFIPPLVTTVAPGAIDPLPTLDNPDTIILFGDENFRKSPKSGARFDIGLWLCPCLGFGAGAFKVEPERTDFFAAGFNGVPILGRPFTNVPGIFFPGPAFDPISFPIFLPDFSIPLSGTIDIDVNNTLWGADIYARYRFICCGLFKLDLLGGAMVTQMRDVIEINTTQNFTFALPFIPPFTFSLNVFDQFRMLNNYYAGMVGAIGQFRSQNWGLYGSAKIGLGNMIQKAEITGQTTTFLATTAQNIFPSGFLAQPSNIGTHSNKRFEVVYRLDAQAQLRIWCNFWLTAGYTYMFWPKVLLAGDQIDLNLNLSQSFGGMLVGPPVPAFNRIEKSFWAHGLTLGLYILY